MTRATLLEGAEQLMLEQGYAAVTYRAVAGRAGVAPGLVQYYFPALDDLFAALLEHGTDRLVEQMTAVASSEQPLRAIWRYASSEVGANLMMEFMALANHRKAIRAKMERETGRVRHAQLQALEAHWDQYGLADSEMTPASLLFMINSVPRMVLLERSFGTRTGHADIMQMIERFLDRVEPKQPPRRKRPSTSS
jgi:AcrR family transcriptional regulator